MCRAINYVLLPLAKDSLNSLLLFLLLLPLSLLLLLLLLLFASFFNLYSFLLSVLYFCFPFVQFLSNFLVFILRLNSVPSAFYSCSDHFHLHQYNRTYIILKCILMLIYRLPSISFVPFCLQQYAWLFESDRRNLRTI